MMPKSLLAWTKSAGALPVLATNGGHQALQGRSKHQGQKRPSKAASAPSDCGTELLLASYGSLRQPMQKISTGLH